MANIESFINGVGNGTSYDLRTYNGSKFDIKWENPLDYLSEAARKEYLQYVEDVHAYLKGKKERCEVYKYDPVNMCTGNYINEHVDISLGGTIAAGISAAGGNMVTQYQKTGTIDSREVATATAGIMRFIAALYNKQSLPKCDFICYADEIGLYGPGTFMGYATSNVYTDSICLLN